MRPQFAEHLHAAMSANEKIVVCTADLGYKMFDKIRADYPDRFFDFGAAEQLMLGAAVGLAQEGFIPITYTITPFYWRAAEWIRNFLNHEGANVKLVGSGRGRDYAHDGFTHDATDDEDLFRGFQAILCRWPDTVEQMKLYVDHMIAFPGPVYLNLRR